MPPKGRSATPVPVRTVRNTRPALNNGINSSYGSRGVAHLGAQMTTGRANETHTHFQVTTRATSRATRGPTPVAPVVETSPSPAAEDSTVRPATALEAAAPYDASQLRQQPAVLPAATPSIREDTPPAREPVAAVPGAATVFWHTLPRYLPQIFRDAEQTVFQALTSVLLSIFLGVLLSLCAVGAIAALFAWTPLPAGLALHRTSLINGLQGIGSGTADLRKFENAGNELMIKIDSNLDAHFQQYMDFISNQEFVNRTEFEDTLAANNAMIKDDMRLSLNRLKEQMLHETKQLIEEKSTTMLSGLSPFRLENGGDSAPAISNLIWNTWRSMHEVNYFSVGHGAVVDPYYTSRTATINSKSWMAALYVHMQATSEPPSGPVVALTAWEEGTQCWCAQHSIGDMAKGQLTVNMAYKIKPELLHIEHIFRSGTRNIFSAPKEFVVWAQADSIAEAERLKKYYYQADICGEAPNRERNWICIGNGKYNIHANNHVQTFKITPSGFPRVETDKIAVRVVENWGAEDHTCFYRVRVTGREVEA